jgi:hypothetical protein
MAKRARVYNGSAWEELASSVTDLSGYATTAQMDTAITTAVDGLPSGALTLINTTTFSAVASQSINDVFSSTYDNYVVMASFTGTDVSVVRLRYRVDGADNSTGNYSYHSQFSSTGSAAYFAVAGNNQTTHFLSSSDFTNATRSVNISILRPFLTNYTSLLGLGSFSASAGAAPYLGGVNLGGFSATTSFTGFSIFPDAGTITGNVFVYGYQK